jgi:hypothetical protein
MRVPRDIGLTAALMGFEAATLAVMSGLHLTGALAGGSKPFDSSGAGIPEAIICIALAVGAVALGRGAPGSRRLAIGALSFAILGFVIGLSFTVRGDDGVGITYHATVLPLLVLTLGSLLGRTTTAHPMSHADGP